MVWLSARTRAHTRAHAHQRTSFVPCCTGRPQWGLCCFLSCQLSHGCQQLLLRIRYTHILPTHTNMHSLSAWNTSSKDLLFVHRNRTSSPRWRVSHGCSQRDLGHNQQHRGIRTSSVPCKHSIVCVRLRKPNVHYHLLLGTFDCGKMKMWQILEWLGCNEACGYKLKKNGAIRRKILLYRKTLTLYGFKNTAVHIFFDWCGASSRDQAFEAESTVVFLESTKLTDKFFSKADSVVTFGFCLSPCSALSNSAKEPW